MQKRLIIMRGLPGSGKSTVVKEHMPNADICSADNFFLNDSGEYIYDATLVKDAHDWCYAVFQGYVSDGSPKIVIDNTNLTLKEIKRYALPAKEAGYEVSVITKRCSKTQSFDRNVHNIPLSVINKMDEKLRSSNKVILDFCLENGFILGKMDGTVNS